MKEYGIDRVNITIIAILRTWLNQPSITEFSSLLGISTGQVNTRLVWLVEHGYIEKEKHRRRSISITQKGLDTYPEFVVLR